MHFRLSKYEDTGVHVTLHLHVGDNAEHLALAGRLVMRSHEAELFRRLFTDREFVVWDDVHSITDPDHSKRSDYLLTGDYKDAATEEHQ